MANFHSSVQASGIVYVYGTWGVVDATFTSVGDDTLGDGRASAPYATVGEALRELQNHLAANHGRAFDKNYYLRLVSEAGENNSYSETVLNFAANLTDNGVYAMSSSSKIIFQGWKKSWGDVQTAGYVGKWTDSYDGEKAKLISGNPLSPSNNSSGGFDGPVMQFKDLIVDAPPFAGTLGLFSVGASTLNTGQNSQLGFQFFGCILRGGFSNTWLSSSNAESAAGFHSCIWENGTIEKNANGLYHVYYQNCVIVFNGPLRQTSIVNSRVSSCIFVPVGQVYNGQSINAPNADLCFYKLGVGASFGVFGGVNHTTLADAIAAGRVRDLASFEIDPLFVDEGSNDYRLQDSSLAVAAGGVSSIQGAALVVDVDSSKKWDQYDFLNNKWSDIQTEEIDVSGFYNRSRRSVGAFQNLSAASPEIPKILFPLTNAVGNPLHVVLSGEASPQGGTLQARVLVADDANFTSNVTVKDSVPITIALGVNDAIDFKEDGGAELNATIAAGTYNSVTLAAAIKTALEAAGTGTYDVTYDGLAAGNTQKYTIAPTATITNIQLLFATGTNAGSSARPFLGFNQADTTSDTSQTSDNPASENFYDAALTWEYATDYDGSSNPTLSGTWQAMGTGEPSSGGVAGTDGALGDGTADIRVNLPQVVGLDGKFVAAALWSGVRLAIL